MKKNISSKNGGFPPLKYLKTEIENDKISKDRLYTSSIKHNINIKQLLSNNKKTFILTPPADEPIEILSEL